MDRDQLLNDQITMLKVMMDGRQASMWTCLPGIITKVDRSEYTCQVQPAIQGVITDEDGNQQYVELPELLDVPIVFPRAGGVIITLPLAVDDEVLVVISSRCIDSWWQSGGIQKPMELRMHDLSDGFAIPGPCSQVMTPGTDFSNSRIEVRNDAGTVYFSMGTKFAMVNATTDLKTLLSDLTSAINSFMTTLAALTPPSTPVVNSVLQVPAATAVTALAAVTAKIDALLEAS